MSEITIVSLVANILILVAIISLEIRLAKINTVVFGVGADLAKLIVALSKNKVIKPTDMKVSIAEAVNVFAQFKLTERENDAKTTDRR